MEPYNHPIINLFLRLTGHSYTNLARLFMRLFVGVMLLQFGVRHLVNYTILAPQFPAMLGLSSVATLNIAIAVELICSLLIMVGFLTRLSTLPPILLMAITAYTHAQGAIPNIPLYGFNTIDPVHLPYLPIMFIGIYIYMLLAGPGKISLDYFISLYIINRRDKDEEEELEEV